MDKKTRKLIETETKNELDGIVDRLININALKDILQKKPLEDAIKPIEFQSFLTGDSRWMEELEETFKDTQTYIGNYLNKLKDVVYYDRLYSVGCLREFKDLSIAIKEFVRYAICPLSNEYRYRQVKLIEDDDS